MSYMYIHQYDIDVYMKKSGMHFDLKVLIKK